MKNKTLLIAILLIWAGSLWAAVEVTLSIPDQHVSRILSAFKTLAGTHMAIESRGSSPNPEDDFDGRWDFRVTPKDPNETNIHFSERFTAELIRACVRCVEYAEDSKRYRLEIADVNVPDVNVPNEIIQ